MKLAAGTRLYTVSNDGHMADMTFEGVLLAYVGGKHRLDFEIFTDHMEAQDSSERIKLNIELMSAVRGLPTAALENVIKHAKTKQGLLSANKPY